MLEDVQVLRLPGKIRINQSINQSINRTRSRASPTVVFGVNAESVMSVIQIRVAVHIIVLREGILTTMIHSVNRGPH
jgi:hypothetical protein